MKDAFANPVSLEAINDTHPVLIPKVDNPTEFRPIALCNVSFKVVTKEKSLDPIRAELFHPRET